MTHEEAMLSEARAERKASTFNELRLPHLVRAVHLCRTSMDGLVKELHEKFGKMFFAGEEVNVTLVSGRPPVQGEVVRDATPQDEVTFATVGYPMPEKAVACCCRRGRVGCAGTDWYARVSFP